MRKAITTAVFILVLASLINGFLGTGARGNSISVDPAPVTFPQTEAADKIVADREEAVKGTKATVVMTRRSAPEEATSETDPVTTTSTTQTTTTSTKAATKATTTTTTKARSTTAKLATTTTTARSTTTATPTTTTTKATSTTAKAATTTTTAESSTTSSKATTSSQALKGYFCYDVEAEVIRLINIERAKEGIGPVTLNPSLRSAAAVRAVEIVDKFSHERPNGERWCTAIQIPYKCAGENIAAGQRTAERVVQAWMNSEGHRKNIMNPRYTEVGVACYHDPNQAYHYYWSQHFIGHN